MTAYGKGDLLRCVGTYPPEFGLPKDSVWVCAGIVPTPFLAFCRQCQEAGINEQVIVELEGVTLPQFYEGLPLAGLCPCGFVPIYKPPPEDVEADECGWLDRRQPNLLPILEPA